MQLTKKMTKPSKQRRMLYKATDHVRHILFGSHLSPELRASHLVKTFPVRSGDTVRVMRGDHKGFEGKVTRIGKRKYRIYVEGLTREKVDGTTIFVPIHPSKVMITNLNLDDKWRKKVLERKKSWQAKPKETRRILKEKQRVEPEQPVKIVGAKPPVADKKVAEEQRTEEEKSLLEKKLLVEKVLAEEKPPRKKTTKAKKKTSKIAAAHETKVESKEPEKEKKPRTEKKKPKRKAAKKTERGE